MDNEFWNNSGVSDNDVNNVMSLSYDTLLAQAISEESKRLRKNSFIYRDRSNFIHIPLTNDEINELYIRGLLPRYYRMSRVWDIEPHWFDSYITELDGYIRKYQWERK